MARNRYFISFVLALWIIIGFTSFVQAQEALIQKQISLSLAEEAAAAAIERCRADGFRVSVAVVDRAGGLKVLLRDDDAGPHTLDSSRRKAFTALSFRTRTTELGQLVATNPSAANLVNISDVLVLGGGIPIRVAQEVIGAIGVGGAPGGKSFAFIENELSLFGCALAFPGLWNRRDELCPAALFNDPLRRLSVGIKLPVTCWVFVGRVKDRAFEK